jgi:hypothetical protein
MEAVCPNLRYYSGIHLGKLRETRNTKSISPDSLSPGKYLNTCTPEFETQRYTLNPPVRSRRHKSRTPSNQQDLGLPWSSTLKIETVNFSETTVKFYRTAGVTSHGTVSVSIQYILTCFVCAWSAVSTQTGRKVVTFRSNLYPPSSG